MKNRKWDIRLGYNTKRPKLSQKRKLEPKWQKKRETNQKCWNKKTWKFHREIFTEKLQSARKFFKICIIGKCNVWMELCLLKLLSNNICITFLSVTLVRWNYPYWNQIVKKIKKLQEKTAEPTKCYIVLA